MRKSHASKGSSGAGALRDGGGGTPVKKSSKKTIKEDIVVRRTPSSSPKTTSATAKLHARSLSSAAAGWQTVEDGLDASGTNNNLSQSAGPGGLGSMRRPVSRFALNPGGVGGVGFTYRET